MNKFHIFNNGLMVETGVSGSDRRVMEWTKIFLKKGYNVDLYTSVYGRKRFEKYGPNFKLIVVNDPLWLNNTFLIYLFRAIRTIKKVKFVGKNEIIYSSSDLIADSIPALVTKIRFKQAKWMTGLHLIAPNPFKDFRMIFQKGLNFPSLKGMYYFISQNFILIFAKKYADLVMVSNALDREKMIRKGFRKDQVIVTYGSADWTTINKTKTKDTIYEASFIGRFHPQKGLDDLLLAWKTICKKNPKAKLVMMGELEELLPKIKELDLEKNIDFLGFVDGVSKFEKLKSSKVFLFPSTYESFGMVACEAMACGLPVVAYNLPIYNAIYPEGMVKVPVGNWQLFAKETEDLLKNEKKRKSISILAKKVAESFSWEKTAEVIIKSLEI